MKLTETPTHVPLVELTVTEEDWAAETPVMLRWMLYQMLLIRAFEEKLLELKNENLIHGPVHTSIGQEGVAAGMGCALRATDKITGTHRAHHQYLAKVLSAHRPEGFDPVAAELPSALREDVRVLLCEIMGLADGCSGGRGGSMHLVNAAAGVLGTNAIVAGGVPHATGAAWADRRLGRDAMTVCFFGDGALYQGVLDESSNLASLWGAPVVYFIENNAYAVGTNVKQSCSAQALHEKAVAYGMPGLRLDGMNPLAVKLGLETLRAQGWLPAYVDAQTYRYLHHAGNLPGSAFGYRVKDEEAEWRARDPIATTRQQLLQLGVVSESEAAQLAGSARAVVHDVAASCVESDGGGGRRVKESLWPAPESLFVGLRDEGPVATRFAEFEDLVCTQEIKYSDAIAAVTGRWLEKDPTVFVCGEEVANMGGGAYGATKGLPKRFPDRVLNTPISEAGFCGLACGAAMNGMHPIVEIMFTSFALVAADQLLNQIAQLGHIYGGHARVPLVVRTRVAIGLGYGAQHSLDPAALYSLFPGFRIFCPTTPFDYIGLFNAAMRAHSPTVIIEHHEYYGRKGMIPSDDLDFVVQPGKAKILRPGRDVTVLAYGWTVAQSLAAAEALAGEGVDAEVIDLRTLDDAGLDWATIGGSLEKTGMLVVAEQSPACNSLGGKIVAEAVRRYFDAFDGVPVQIAAPSVPIPVSKRLEALCIPTVEQIAVAIRKAARRKV